jgi:hypothetical protein
VRWRERFGFVDGGDAELYRRRSISFRKKKSEKIRAVFSQELAIRASWSVLVLLQYRSICLTQLAPGCLHHHRCFARLQATSHQRSQECRTSTVLLAANALVKGTVQKLKSTSTKSARVACFSYVVNHPAPVPYCMRATMATSLACEAW